MEERMATTVPVLESAASDACLHDDNIRDALINHIKDEAYVRKALSDYGIKFDDVQWKNVYKEIKNIKWNDLNQVEIALGRDPRMG
jgi:hypothetical protein